MTKTIKEVADMLGIPKQRVYRYVHQNHISDVHHKDGVIHMDDALVSLIVTHFQKVPVSGGTHQSHINDAVLDAVISERQFLREEIVQLRKLLDQEQQLHLATQQKYQLLLDAPKKKWYNPFRSNN